MKYEWDSQMRDKQRIFWYSIQYIFDFEMRYVDRIELIFKLHLLLF